MLSYSIGLDKKPLQPVHPKKKRLYELTARLKEFQDLSPSLSNTTPPPIKEEEEEEELQIGAILAQVGQQQPIFYDEPRLGIYTEKERELRLEQFREKRKRLRYGQLKYALRQKVSSQKPRVKGRFVKINSPETQNDSENLETASSLQLL